MFIIKTANKAIGFVTLYDLIFREGKTKFGMALLHKYQNFGLGVKVFAAIRTYVFMDLNFNIIESEVIEYNTTVSNMLLKMGFNLSDVKKGKVVKCSKKYDLEVYTLAAN